ncbi:MAG TPA: FAD-linked oxidase C-terminal domain-containing protein [Casimicrobiaceae bacterium]|jgi:glycolate oxidase|nr:FAD-linked oxidase C-terminal domain-containing protein [Casimicrobiaceae bacterium]
MLNETLLAALGEILPPSALLTAAEDTRPYECDGLTLFRAQPLAVLLPENEAQVVEILKICNAARLPVVARGAGTGLSGGATPNNDGVVLSLAKFKRILAIDPLARSAVLQPGVRNLAISEAVAVHGLYYAPDPSSQIACTIGGNVAENSGGLHCLKYGLTVHNVRRVRAVLITGEIVEFGSDALDSAGYDLLALINGSEGLLAVTTEVTVRLTPKPREAKCILAAFDELASAGQAVAAIIAAGIIPAGLEMMDRLTISAVEPFVHAGYPLDAEAILLCEADGTPEEVQADIEEMRALLEECGATRVEVSQNEAQRLRLWSGRKAAFPAAGRVSPDYYCIDGTIPRREIAPVLTRIAELGREFGLRCMNVFHAGDGNLHPLILFDANRPGDAEKTEAFGAKILELCIEVGGTITGEHGVGLEKIGGMCVQFSSAELEWFHAIKHAFDDGGLLNPGKAVPALYRCAEMGRMHVHRGQLPHPDLPRF